MERFAKARAYKSIILAGVHLFQVTPGTKESEKAVQAAVAASTFAEKWGVLSPEEIEKAEELGATVGRIRRSRETTK